MTSHEPDCDRYTSGGMNGCICDLLKKVRAETQMQYRDAIKTAASGFGWAKDGAYARACDEVYRMAMRGEITPEVAGAVTRAIDALRATE